MSGNELFIMLKSLLNRLDEMSLAFDMQNFNRGERLFEHWSKDYGMILTEIIGRKVEINAGSIAVSGTEVVDESVISIELKGLLTAMEQKDYVLMSDILRLQIRPFIQSLILPVGNLTAEELSKEGDSEEAIFDITGYEYEDAGRIYRLEPTASGLLTLSVSDETGTYYMHGNDNPYSSAKLMSMQYYDVKAEKYVVFGLGLGYHVLALCEACHGLVPIEVYETDEVVLELSRRTVDLSAYERKCLTIILDPGLEKFSLAASSGTLMIHYPSIRNIRNDVLRDRMNQLFVQDSSIRNQVGEMLANFRYNAANISDNGDMIKPTVAGKDVILVAAGPSLDRNINILKKLRESDKCIICVGTAFRKLMNAGIEPDYVAFMDASERIRAQIRGFEGADVPALMASTATMSITRDYAGRKYIICQKGMDEAEFLASKKGYDLYESGGSVATLIMDIAVHLGARRVITVGLDLAYTDSKYHADGAGRSTTIESLDGLLEVKASDGTILYTTQAMNMYREWFEEYIKRHENCKTEFINATEGGVKISGMKEMALEDIDA